MMTIDQRLSALPPADQSLITGFIEYLEWKRRLPDAKRAGSPDRGELGERLRAVRETLNQSQEQAAVVAGVALTTYSQYERGIIGRWPTRKVIDYANAWNVSFDWLIAGNGTMFSGDRRPDIAPSAPPTGKPPARRLSATLRADRAATAPNVIPWPGSGGTRA